MRDYCEFCHGREHPPLGPNPDCPVHGYRRPERKTAVDRYRVCDECGIWDGHRGTCSRYLMRSGAPAPYSWAVENEKLSLENAQLREALTSLYQMELERKMLSAQSIPAPSVYVYQPPPPPQERHSPALVFGILGIIFALAVISQLIWAFH